MEPKDLDRGVARGIAFERHRRRWVSLLAVIVVLGLGSAACGGGSPKSSSSPSGSGSSGSGSSNGSATAEALKFSQCMRSHGITNYPDESVSGNGGQASANLPSSINTNSSTFQAAEQACQKYQPTDNSGSGQQPPNSSARLKHAECMRSHGVTNYPDPGSNGETIVNGIDVQSPTYQAAARTCQSLLSGG